MYKINPTVFTISEEEVKETVKEMIERGRLGADLKLNRMQIVKILACVEGDGMLAKDIRASIKGSIIEVLE
ncbi:MAG: hypothetical protein UR66_C0014G0003 [Candidatus Moranbacteria bacterium GW2011_GWE1_35_17]|nr:MAG: hypothetical protein UR66_C0014G0003 [Candidatus Moranbacteria bacterium GW2011_GWE1_35_17]KKP67884.1 MAG: hypothetical protein UR65_C0064G0003 [Candidatus Moranbacteria bacterium GW2011_GWE2_35_164]KKP81461.1 MAG: hypothetical protein UR82_C0061G0002 [Candidatus Moranbacteria bacterium GW2011_GWF1_35_5]KKP81788.1 MAG: hypothetical protein UR83_C0066G0004 [Candidatus Moranbacteria bacterium GW2011_GWF2_35_54]HBR78876.1 hypothetical protein [Candidatus Moranbacteria bacterium]